jgi:hypothetical protein
MEVFMRQVYIEEIAEILTVNKWFTVPEFIALTGMTDHSGGARLRSLLKDGMLERRENGRNINYMMTAGCHDAMIAKSEKQQEKKRRKALKRCAVDKGVVVKKADLFNDLLLCAKWV